MTVEEIVSTANAMSDEDFKDLEHFVATNEIPVMKMSKFDKMGFCNKHCHPTEFAKAVVEEVNG